MYSLILFHIVTKAVASIGDWSGPWGRPIPRESEKGILLQWWSGLRPYLH